MKLTQRQLRRIISEVADDLSDWPKAGDLEKRDTDEQQLILAVDTLLEMIQRLGDFDAYDRVNELKEWMTMRYSR